MLKILGFHEGGSESIRSLLGVSSGPIPYGEGVAAGFPDLSDQFQSLGVKSIRTQDYANGSFNVMYFFPERHAEASDPESYEWTQTDKAYQAILDIDADPFIRLGLSWRNMLDWGAFGIQNASGYAGYGPFWSGDKPLSTTMVEKGAEIFTTVVERYTDKQKWGSNPLKNGYVEIWNEPNIIGINTVIKNNGFPNPSNKDQYEYSTEFPNYMWDGTPEQFYKFFADTALTLKEKFPDLKIGGPGLHNVGLGLPKVQPPESNYKNEIGLEWTKNFLEYLSSRNVDLDFFSWHLYSSEPQDYLTFYHATDKLLSEYGFGETEQILSEWNTLFDNDNASSVLGAAQVNAIWIALQNETDNLSQAIFCRGADGPFIPNGDGFPIMINSNGTNLGPENFGEYGVGLLTKDGVYKPSAYAFSFWSEMAGKEPIDLDRYYSNPSDDTGLYSLAGTRTGTLGKDLQILISHLPEQNDNEEIVLNISDIAESFKMDRDSVVISTVSELFAKPSKIKLPKDGQFTIPTNQVISIQMRDYSADANIFFQTSALSNEVGELIATEPANWKIIGGDDRELFEMDPVTAELSFKQTPDQFMINPEDQNEIFSVIVEASSTSDVVTQEIFVEVNSNEESINRSGASIFLFEEITGKSISDFSIENGDKIGIEDPNNFFSFTQTGSDLVMKNSIGAEIIFLDVDKKELLASDVFVIL